MKTIALFYVYFCIPVFVTAQTTSPQEIDALNNLAWERIESDPDSALLLAQQAITAAMPLQYSHGLGNAYSTIGFVKRNTNAAEAFNAWKNAIAYRKKIGDSIRIANIYNQIAVFKVDTGDYPGALKYAHDAINILNNPSAPTFGQITEMQRRRNLGSVYITLSKVYGLQEMTNDALRAAQQAAKVFFQNNNRKDSSDALLNLADTYYYGAVKGRAYIDTAIRVYKQYLAYIQIETEDWYPDDYYTGFAYHNLALILLKRGNPGDTTEAQLLLDKSDTAFARVGPSVQSEGLFYTQTARGQILLKTNPTKALAFLKEAEKRCFSGIPAPKRLELWNLLAKGYEATGVIKQAYQYQRLAYQLQDTLQNENVFKKTHIIDNQQHEVEKTRNTLELSAKNIKIKNVQLIAAGLFSALLFLVLLFMVYRRQESGKLARAFEQLRKETQKFAEKVRAEERRILGDKVHGIASALTTLSKVVEMVKEQTATSSTLYPPITYIQDGLVAKATEAREQSRLLNDGEPLDGQMNSSLKEYLDNICQIFSSLNKIKAEHKTELDKLTPEMEVCIGGIVEELITNTLKHARAKNIRIFITQKEQNLILHYTDDGIGFPKLNNSAGNGLKDIERKVRSLGGAIPKKGNHPDGKGIEFEIVLPLSDV